MLEAKIICEKDVQALSTILKICELSRIKFRMESTFDYYQSLETNCGLIQKSIDYAPALQKINNTMVEPTLYKMQIEEEKQPNQ